MFLSNIFKKCSRTETFRSGLTLIELLITISIVGIISAIAVPILRDFLPIYRLNQAARILVVDFQYARTRAISHNKKIRVLFDIENNSYKMQCHDHNEWKDLAGEPERNLGNAGVCLTAANKNPVFSPQGLVGGMVTAQIKNSRGTRAITVSMSGRVKVLR